MTTQYAYVGNLSDGTVSKIDTTTDTVVDTIALASGQPLSEALSTDTLFVGTRTPLELYPIDGTDAVGSPTGLGQQPTFLVIHGTHGYNASNTATTQVEPFDTVTHATGTPFTVGNRPGQMVIDSAGTTGYVVLEADGTFVPIAIPANTVGSPVAVTSAPLLCQLTPDDLTLYIADHGTAGTITPVTLPSTVGTGVPFPGGHGNPQGMTMRHDGATIYLSDYDTGKIFPFDVGSNTFGAGLASGGGQPGPSALLPDDSKLYVAVIDINAVVVIDTASFTIIATIPVGNSPVPVVIGNIAVTPPPPAVTIENLFIPRKGRAGLGGGYEPVDLIINWLAIENWANHGWTPAVTNLYIPNKPEGRELTVAELDQNWLAIENWANAIGTINAGGVTPVAIPPLFIPRKSSLEPEDLDIDFLRIQNWANSLNP